ncbi:MAG: type II secretion system protein N [Rhodoferax sp.]|nr:type II secretion system protein N [Rhodoferax sp.]MCB2003530.1 type II secretion system protein N [Rhodoferax sp.]MCB2031064.1 type II secretion system protein N [Rhodoferax sp.]MCB2039517.1 type II secretion system protein N [Rhodoferax sp.]MCP5260711.1 type II secretion system protein N [Rhodoferax sp.]
MRESRWAWLGAIAGIAAGVLAFAPAAWLAAALHAGTGGRVQAAQPRGTVWNGSARLVLAGGAGSQDARVLPGRMAWQLRPTWTGARLQLRAECCMTRALDMTLALRWGGGSLAWADHDSQWPAQALVGWGAPWNTLQAEGRLLLTLQGLSLEWLAGRTRVTGSLSLDALALSSRLSTLRPIGSYRLRLIGNGSNGPPELQLQTLEGSLQVSGQGRWTGARWNFRGQASASAQDQVVLGNLLNIVGRRQGAVSIIAVD